MTAHLHRWPGACRGAARHAGCLLSSLGLVQFPYGGISDSAFAAGLSPPYPLPSVPTPSTTLDPAENPHHCERAWPTVLLLPHCWHTIPNTHNLEEERFILAQFLKVQSIVSRLQGSREQRAEEGETRPL